MSKKGNVSIALARKTDTFDNAVQAALRRLSRGPMTLLVVLVVTLLVASVVRTMLDEPL